MMLMPSACVVRALELHFASFKVNRSFVRFVNSGKDLHQRGFPAHFTKKSKDFSQ
jgi:hypothetical protein